MEKEKFTYIITRQVTRNYSDNIQNPLRSLWKCLNGRGYVDVGNNTE